MEWTKEEQEKALQKLREPFPENQIGKLAKGSKAQTQCANNEKQNCKVCGGWHHPKMIHLDYVGHAALTDRLLDCDINWSWEPFATNEVGLPAYDNSGGLWIRLTVAGMTRLGYGHAPESQYKEIGSREKETIGDALRNAAMRFGAALELWHKGDLHVANPSESVLPIEEETKVGTKTAADFTDEIDKCKTTSELQAYITSIAGEVAETLKQGEKSKLTKYYKQIYADVAKTQEGVGGGLPGDRPNEYKCEIPGSGLTTTKECVDQQCPSLKTCQSYQNNLAETF